MAVPQGAWVMGARLVFGQGRFSVRGPGQGISGAPESPRCLRGFRRVDQAKRIHADARNDDKKGFRTRCAVIPCPNTFVARKPALRRVDHPITRDGAELGRITPRAFAALDPPYKTAPDSRTRHGLPSHRRVDQAKRIHAVSGIAVKHAAGRLVDLVREPKTSLVRKPIPRRMYHPIKRHGAKLGRITPRAFAALDPPYETTPKFRIRRRVDQAKRIHAVSGIGVMPRRTRSVRGIPVSGLRPKTFPVRKPAHRCTS